MKNKTNISIEDMLKIVIAAENGDMEAKYKRIIIYLEANTGAITLKDALPILEASGIDIKEFCKYLYSYYITKNKELSPGSKKLLFELKLIVEEAIDRLGARIDQFEFRKTGIDEQIRDIGKEDKDLEIELKQLEGIITKEDLYVEQNGMHSPGYLRRLRTNPNVRLNKMLRELDPDPKLSQDDIKHYTEFIRGLNEMANGDMETLDNAIKEQNDFLNPLGKTKLNEILEAECPELIDYRKLKEEEKKHKKDARIAEIEASRISISEKKEKLTKKRNDLEMTLKKLMKQQEGLEEVCQNCDEKLPLEYQGTRKEREERQQREERKSKEEENAKYDNAYWESRGPGWQG